MLGLSASVLLAAVAVLADDNLHKDTLFKNGLSEPLSRFSEIHTPAYETWPSSIPEVCKKWSTGPAYGHDGDVSCSGEMTAIEIKIEDCEDTWTLCRCGNAEMNMDDFARRFAQVPPGIRSYTGAALAAQSGGCSGVTLDWNFIRYHGDCGFTVFLHESGHALDGAESWNSEAFHKAVDESSCVPDDYANSNWVENWTQLQVIYTYWVQFGEIPANYGCLYPSLMSLWDQDRIMEALYSKTCLKERRPYMVEENTMNQRRSHSRHFPARGLPRALRLPPSAMNHTMGFSG